jgi:hypothetical protein
VFEIHRKEVNSSLLEVKAMNKDTEADSDSDRKIKEEERRRKIGLANKGKVPWNKGRKHSEDTRRRIKQRTIEALTNPKVKSSKIQCKFRDILLLSHLLLFTVRSEGRKLIWQRTFSSLQYLAGSEEDVRSSTTTQVDL